MDRVNTYSVNQIVTSAQLNEIQDNAVGGITPPLGNLNGANPGERLVHFESAADLPDDSVRSESTANPGALRRHPHGRRASHGGS